jgi:zinc transport system substrate-binding protein
MKVRRQIVFFGSLAVVSLSLLSCGSKTIPGNPAKEMEKISVYTSFYAMYDLTQKIGGDRIRLVNLVPAGTEPHEWEPSTGDIVHLEKADVLVYNGASMEGWVSRVIATLKNKRLIAVEASRDIKLHDNPEKAENLKYDPHVWLYPMNAIQEMKVIMNALSNADPANADYFRSNYHYYSGKFSELDREYRETLATVKNRSIIVSHQAFGYLCEAYGLNQIAIEGLSADSEPSTKKMAEIVQFARKRGVKYIFFEDLVSPKVAEAVAREIGAQTETLNPLEGLTEKELSEGKEYLSVMKCNLAALKKALQ